MALSAGGDSAGTSGAAVGEFEDGRMPVDRRQAKLDRFGVLTEHTNVSASVDDRAARVKPGELLDGTIHGKPFGDSTQVDPKRALKCDAEAREQVNVTP